MLTNSQVTEFVPLSHFDRKIYLSTCSQGVLSDIVKASFELYRAS